MPFEPRSGVPAGVLAVARSVLHQGDSSISAPLAELGLQPVSAVVASAVNAQTGVCCGLFLQAVASSGLKPLSTFAEVAARLASSHDATARRHGFVALARGFWMLHERVVLDRRVGASARPSSRPTSTSLP